MEQTAKPKKLWKKRLLTAAAVVAAVVLVLLAAVFALWHNEIFSLASMTLIRERDDAHLDGAVYRMDVKGGFYLDEFVAQGGAESDKELIDFITGKITKGLVKMNISETPAHPLPPPQRTAAGCLHGTTTSPRPIPALCAPRPTRAATPPSPR